jgi:hypothetical protein
MSKYKPLTEHLRSRNEPFWRATFDDVESVLGFALPKAAEDKSGWWDNGGTTGHSRAWVDAGWHVESVDRPGRRVMFHREGYGAEDEAPELYFAPAKAGPLVTKPPGDSLKRTAGWTAAIGGAVAVAAGLSVLALRRRKKT